MASSNVESTPERLTVSEVDGVRLVEGAPGRPVMRSVDDTRSVLEACFSGGVDAVLLYASNLTEGFFDLSSGQAGAILQKLRTYRIRLAVVCHPEEVRFSARFKEMLAEESAGDHFRIVESAEAARSWLSRAGESTSAGSSARPPND